MNTRRRVQLYFPVTQQIKATNSWPYSTEKSNDFSQEFNEGESSSQLVQAGRKVVG
jgi:hypothetical protein